MKSVPLMFHRGNSDVLLNMHSKLAVPPTMAVAFSGPLVISTPIYSVLYKGIARDITF